MKCVSTKCLVLILIFLITFCGFQIFSKNIRYYYNATYSYDDDATRLNDEYNKVAIIRQIPDTRDARCPRQFDHIAAYNAKVSIIITYHNESLSTLLLTICSIYKRTPLKYLQEIIVIDDCSEDDTILKNLRKFVKYSVNLAKLIKTKRNLKRLGLIRSRNLGAELALGNYLLFMDSHCEVNEQWLESLLATIASKKSSNIAVSPLLDNIDADTGEYKASSAFIKGGFDWNLHFHWMPRDKTLNPILPFRSPTFAGGIFLISRNWFFKLKAFNTRLEIWGGESLEFSLKLWLCGGDEAEIQIVPCSRVGHIFRKEHIFKFPENNGQYTYLRNSKIIAETWLEHYKYNFYNLKPEAKNIFINYSRLEDKYFKDSMNCRAFEWYLENIFPELRNLENYTANGILASSASLSANLCLHHELNENQNQNNQYALLMINCYNSNITEWFLLKDTFQLQSVKGLCLNIQKLLLQHDESGTGIGTTIQYKVVLENCLTSGSQSWQRFGLQLRHFVTGMCLEVTVEFELTVNRCRKLATMQHFRFQRELEKL